jgi:hypothetical protein
MIAPYVKAVETEVEVEGQDADGPVWKEPNPIAERCRTLSNAAVKNIAVVKMKGAVEGIGIRQNARDKNYKNQE